VTQIMAKIKMDAIPAWAKIRYALAISKTDVRVLPAADRLFSRRLGGVDVLQAGRLLPGEPVVVLFETTDRSWMYVQSARQRGWVASMQLAMAFSREHWLSFANSQDFVIVTAPALFIEQEQGTQSLATMELPMGTRLPLVPKPSTPDAVKSRGTADSYVVLLPSRRVDGKLNVVPALLPRTTDVSEGYLALTGENIVRQSMKLVGTRYGHKGSLGRDPYILVSDVFRCMGIEVPVSAEGYAALPFATQDIKGLAPDLKVLSFRKAVPGSILMLENGPSIFLGQYGEDVYAIAALTQVRMPSKSSTSYELLDIAFNGISLVSLKSVYSETGNDFFTEAKYLMEPVMK
jgi:cell wall-associated NlpC family hydrolase